MTATVKRLRVPFCWSAEDGLGANGKLVARSYRTELEAVFTRAGQKRVADQNGVIATVAHSAAPFARVGGFDTLLVERVGAGAWTYSEDISNAAFGKSGATVSGPVAGPDGRLTAYRLVEAATTAAHYMTRGVTVTAGTRQAMVAVIRANGRPLIKLYICDSATQANSVQVRLDLATGVFSSIANLGTGSGAKAHAQPLGNGYWEIRVDGIAASAATTLTAFIIMTQNGVTDSYTGDGASGIDVDHWGFEVGREVATSIMSGTASAGARVADLLFFPVQIVPQELTAYVRGIERLRPDLAAPTDSALFYLGAAAGTGAGRIALYRTTAEAGYRALHQSAAGTSVATAVGAAAVFGDTVEARLLLSAAGAVSHGVSINGGAESVSAAGTAYALDSAFGAARLYLNSFGAGTSGAFAFRKVVVALGTKTMAEMRALAESA